MDYEPLKSIIKILFIHVLYNEKPVGPVGPILPVAPVYPMGPVEP
jgi:hypothetical protein